jgi:hypothetical protein
MSENLKTMVNQVITQKIDHSTGEIVESEKEDIVKVPQTPDFVMTFTQDIGFIANISSAASKLLFGILVKIDRANEIVLVKETKEIIAEMVGLKTSTVSKLVTELYQAKVLLKKNSNSRSGVYVLNPYFFGKGRWVNINKLRMLVEYDFKNSKKTVGIETEYIDNKDDYIGQLIEHQDVVLNELEKINQVKNDNSFEPSLLRNESIPSNSNNFNPNFINDEDLVQNRSKTNLELENENLRLRLANKEADNEALRLQIQLASIQN